jgi:hypothetical protein
MTSRGNDIVPPKIQETIFSGLLKKQENSECADCRAKSPTWVSIDFGVFVCMRCSGVHRSLGPSITRVRSTKLDSFKFDFLNILASVGNRLANEYYEHRMPSGYRRPTTNSSSDDCVRFVTEKYVKKSFALQNTSTPVEKILNKEEPTTTTSEGSQQTSNSRTIIDLSSNCFDKPASPQIDLLSFDESNLKPITWSSAPAEVNSKSAADTTDLLGDMVPITTIPKKEEKKDNKSAFSFIGKEKSGSSSKNPDFKAFARATKEVQKENVAAAVVDITKLYSQPQQKVVPQQCAPGFNYPYFPNTPVQGPYYNYGYPVPTYYPNHPIPAPTVYPQQNLKNVDIKSLYGQGSSSTNNYNSGLAGITIPMV